MMKKLILKSILANNQETLLFLSLILSFFIYKLKFVSYGIFYEELIYFYPHIEVMTWSDILSLPLAITHAHPPGMFVIQKLLSYFVEVNNTTLHILSLINASTFLVLFYFYLKYSFSKIKSIFITLVLAVTPLFLTHSTLWLPDVFILTLSLAALLFYRNQHEIPALVLWIISFLIRETALAFPLALFLSTLLQKKKFDLKLGILIIVCLFSLLFWNRVSTGGFFPNMEFAHNTTLSIQSLLTLGRTFAEIMYSTFGTFLIQTVIAITLLRYLFKIKHIKILTSISILLVISPIFYSSIPRAQFLLNFIISSSDAYTVGLINIVDGLAIISLTSGVFLLIHTFIQVRYSNLNPNVSNITFNFDFFLSLIIILEFLTFYLLYNDFNMRDFVSILPFTLFLLFFLIRDLPTWSFSIIIIIIITLSLVRNTLIDQWKLLETEAQYTYGQNIVKDVVNTIIMDPQYNIAHKCIESDIQQKKVYFTNSLYGFLNRSSSDQKECSHYIKSIHRSSTQDWPQKNLLLSKKFDNEIILLYHR